MLGLKRPHRVGRRALSEQGDRAVEALRVLVGVGSATCHPTYQYYLSRPNPSLRAPNRALELEIRYCVGAVERSLRGPVIHRKLSHGTRSKDGERFVERALSASVTCRLQSRSLFAYLVELLSARARGQPLPALA